MLFVFMRTLLTDVTYLAQVRSKRITHFHGSGAFALTHEILALPCLLNKPSTNGWSSCNDRPPSDASGIDYTPQNGRYEVARPVGGTEDSDAPPDRTASERICIEDRVGEEENT